MSALATLPEATEVLRRISRHPLAARTAVGVARAGVEAGAPVLVLASGGADSTALLVLLAALWERAGRSIARLHVVAFDHGLRPEAADEARHAVRIARHLGAGDCWIEQIAVERGGNLLANAREARLAAVAQICARRRLGTVALGHHADDRAETVLLALARGASLGALTALAARRDFLGTGVTLVRPLLDIRREELRSLLLDVGIGWCEDPSNRTRQRGAMREGGAGRDLLEAMTGSLGALSDEAAELLDLRDALANELLERGENPGPGVSAGVAAEASAVAMLPRAELDRAHPAVRRAALIALGRASGVALARRTLEAALRILDAGDRSPHAFAGDGGATLALDARGARITLP